MNMSVRPPAREILVTGGAGFIGSHLCERLLAQGHRVWCLDNLSTGSVDNIATFAADSNFEFIEGDVEDPFPDLNVDEIYNLACPASPPQYQKDPIKTMRTNVLGALNALAFAERNNATILQASTSEVYGDPEISPQSEDYRGSVSCTGPRACYDEGKRAAETLFYDAHRTRGVSIRVARIFNTYGPRMHPQDGRVIPNFVMQALLQQPLTVYGDGTQTRSFCYVDDLVDGLITLMQAKGSRVGPINLGSDAEMSIGSVADVILEMTGSTSQIASLPLPKDDPKIRRPDLSAARERLGWAPKTPLKEGLASTIAFFQNELSPAVNQARSETCTSGETVPTESLGPNSMTVIGGGPAGLTAAYVMTRDAPERTVTVLEASEYVGGIARTESYKGYRFDIGGHRFFTKVPEVSELWREVAGDDFLRRPRLSRIFYRGKYYSYPLKIFNALGNMGPYEASRIMLSYAKRRVMPLPEEDNLEQWVTNRFGGRLFWHFFKTYTEKVWGIPCEEIRADWAAQRIQNLSLTKAVWNAVSGANDTASLIEEFDYPRLGPGMMWEKFRDAIAAQGGRTRMNSAVTAVHRDGNRVTGVDVCDFSEERKRTYRLSSEQFISTMPLRDLINAMNPPPPDEVLEAAEKLKYRDFLIVNLILDHEDPFPDNWIYIHSPDVQVGRIQNFRAWSSEMVPDEHTSCIGMEYFCHEGDGLWATDDKGLIAKAAEELEALGLADKASVIDGVVTRQPKAYPVYDQDYAQAVGVIAAWIDGLENFQTVGRNGMHRYNNQDHSMLTAMLAVKNILGETHDLWSVNVERSYHEEFTTDDHERSVA